MRLKELIAPNVAARGAAEMSLPLTLDKKSRNIAGRKVRKEKVVVRNSKTGQIYGTRTVFQKAT